MAWDLVIENVAGIRRGEAHVEPGVNAVRASNWQGKSSFIAAIEAAFGTATPLTEGERSGRVVLTTEDGEYAVDLERGDGTVTRSGSPYLREEADRVGAALFAFLDEDNEVRRAVRNGDDLEELLTRPLDFENVDERIAARKSERSAVSAELDRASEAASRLTDLQDRVTALESDLEELREERADLDADAPEDDGRERLSELRAERDRTETQIARHETTVEGVRETLAETRAELDDFTVQSADDVAEELESVRSDLREVERDRELLQSVYEANRRVLDEDRVELLTDVTHDVLADEVTCWLCGDETTREDVEAQLSALDERIGSLRAEADRFGDRVDALEEERDEIRRDRRRKQDLTDRVGELESRLAETEERLANARERRADLEARIEDLAAEVDTAEDRVTDLESEIKYTEAELEDAREELAETESLAAQREALEAEYDALTEEITELRSRKERVERRTREAFSAALDDLLDRFDTGFETARLTSTFDLVVAREGREASLDALSEGERELLGFVAALAGHEAFDVGDRVPVMLLDGLGGLASDNLAVLVEYLRERTEYLVLTAYPEHGDFEGHELSPSEWDVVSNDTDARASP